MVNPCPVAGVYQGVVNEMELLLCVRTIAKSVGSALRRSRRELSTMERPRAIKNWHMCVGYFRIAVRPISVGVAWLRGFVYNANGGRCV
ncbi:MAG: hypothetical protein V3T88_05345 [Nitrosomonadaceae bacterium]